MKKSLLTLSATLICCQSTIADHKHSTTMEEVYIESQRNSQQAIVDLPDRPVFDTAQLLKQAPGANQNSNGPLTGIAQIRGLYAQRINTQINGNKIASGGPNLMDAPLHYAPAVLLEELTVYRDIAPVSVGQETLGGAIKANTWKPAFAEGEETALSGKLVAGYESVNDATEFAAFAAAAGQHHRLGAVIVDNRGNDSEFADGKIIPSEFERQRGDITYGYRRNGHLLTLSAFRNETGDAGTAALPMDIEYVDTDSGQLGYKFDDGDWGLNLHVNYADVEHVMTNFHLRQPPQNAMQFRSTLATGESWDGHFQLWFDRGDKIWRLGLDRHSSEHDADISNPNNAMFLVENFNEAKQDITGFYAEVQSKSTDRFQYQLGLRVNRVDFDSGEVNFSGMMGMMQTNAAALSNAFNTSDRSGSDTNVDGVIGLSYQLNKNLKLVSSFGIKNRSAVYQERYLWLPMQATAGLADGNTYIGNIDLKPESSREVNLGFDFEQKSFSVSPRIFYKEIDDYIQGTVSTNMTANMLANMMNPGSTPLQFSNIDARLYGGDLDSLWNISDHWQFTAVLSYVRGEREDIDDNLYRVAPLNGILGLSDLADSWNATLELEAADNQSKVSALNNETESSGYSIWHLRGQKSFSGGISVAAGVENIFDKNHAPHLAGVNRALGSDVSPGERIPGDGRSFYTQLSMSF